MNGWPRSHVELGVITGCELNGSSSPVLTVNGDMSFLYMEVCDFLGFFPNWPGGHTPRPISTQNGSNDVGSRKDVPFGVKIATFWNPWPPDAQNRQNLPNFGRELENFRPISRLTLEVSRLNTAYSSPEPNKSVIVNRQCGGGKFKYVPNFAYGVQVT